MDENFWKVGELARRTGITVRTLHHYDALGLLQPMRDPQSGHRIYGIKQLERLLRILALSRMGFTLARIKSHLDAPQEVLGELLREQVSRLRRQLAEQQRLLHTLEEISIRLDCGETFAAEDLLDAIEVNMDIEKYFTQEQRERLQERRGELGEDAIRTVEVEWPELIAAMRTQMERGADPGDPAVAKLARRWSELVRQFSGGDAGIEQAVGTAYREEPGLAASMGLDAELFGYAGRAMAALDDETARD